MLRPPGQNFGLGLGLGFKLLASASALASKHYGLGLKVLASATISDMEPCGSCVVPSTTKEDRMGL